MTTNSTIGGLYSFKLAGTDQKDRFKLIRLSKIGNSEPWNAVFSSDQLSVRKLGPIVSAEDHIAFVFDLNKDSHKDRKSIVLQTSTFMMPFGIGQDRDDKDFYIFKVSADNEFEVYVADTAGKDRSIILQMFTDGSFDNEIRVLKERAA